MTDRRFLRDLNREAKRKVLRDVLRSNASFAERHHGETYLSNYTEKALAASSGCIRSNCHTECRVTFSSDRKRLVAQYIASYRLYPNEHGEYEDIRFGRIGERRSKQDVVLDYARVGLPNGSVEEFYIGDSKGDNDSHFEVKDEENGDQHVTIPINEIGESQPHLDVTLRMWEYGNDHWIAVGFQAMQPTDGFRFTVLCMEPLEIRNEQVFVYGSTRTKYPKNIVGRRDATISCQQWVEKGSGLTMLIGIRHAVDESEINRLSTTGQLDNEPNLDADGDADEEENDTAE